MSALGQKRTSRRVEPMSALPPIADIGVDEIDVRFVPLATKVQRNKNGVLFTLFDLSRNR